MRKCRPVLYITHAENWFKNGADQKFHSYSPLLRQPLQDPA